MFTLWMVWAALTLVVISLGVARRVAARKDDEYVHLADAELAAIPHQVALANKLERIDTWGKRLTIVDVAFGLVLLAVLIYQTWQQTGAVPN